MYAILDNQIMDLEVFVVVIVVVYKTRIIITVIVMGSIAEVVIIVIIAIKFAAIMLGLRYFDFEIITITLFNLIDPTISDIFGIVGVKETEYFLITKKLLDWIIRN